MRGQVMAEEQDAIAVSREPAWTPRRQSVVPREGLQPHRSELLEGMGPQTSSGRLLCEITRNSPCGQLFVRKMLRAHNLSGVVAHDLSGFHSHFGGGGYET